MAGAIYIKGVAVTKYKRFDNLIDNQTSSAVRQIDFFFFLISGFDMLPMIVIDFIESSLLLGVWEHNTIDHRG